MQRYTTALQIRRVRYVPLPYKDVAIQTESPSEREEGEALDVYSTASNDTRGSSDEGFVEDEVDEEEEAASPAEEAAAHKVVSEEDEGLLLPFTPLGSSPGSLPPLVTSENGDDEGFFEGFPDFEDIPTFEEEEEGQEDLVGQPFDDAPTCDAGTEFDFVKGSAEDAGDPFSLFKSFSDLLMESSAKVLDGKGGGLDVKAASKLVDKINRKVI